MAATAWPTNGAMIADLARLGYLRRSDRVIDPTWGRGVWWRSWQPDELVRHDPDLFFFERGSGRAQAAKAKEVCRGCPVTAECLDFGLHERLGVWGGLTPQERRKEARRRAHEARQDEQRRGL